MADDFNIFDLNELALNGGQPRYLVARCKFCGEIVHQQDCECPVCGVPSVWLNSPEWKRHNGNPQTEINRLRRPKPDEDDDLGRTLLSKLNVTSFATLTQKNRWKRARKKINPFYLEKMINSVTDKHRKPSAALAHLLNWTDKVIREQETQKKAPKPQIGTPIVPEGM